MGMATGAMIRPTHASPSAFSLLMVNLHIDVIWSAVRGAQGRVRESKPLGMGVDYCERRGLCTFARLGVHSHSIFIYDIMQQRTLEFKQFLVTLVT